MHEHVIWTLRNTISKMGQIRPFLNSEIHTFFLFRAYIFPYFPVFLQNGASHGQKELVIKRLIFKFCTSLSLYVVLLKLKLSEHISPESENEFLKKKLKIQFYIQISFNISQTTNFTAKCHRTDLIEWRFIILVAYSFSCMS